MDAIIRSPRGAARCEVPVSEIRVPDLWHVAMFLQEENPDIGHNHLRGQSASEAILETWHLCHDLLENIRNPKL